MVLEGPVRLSDVLDLRIPEKAVLEQPSAASSEFYSDLFLLQLPWLLMAERDPPFPFGTLSTSLVLSTL